MPSGIPDSNYLTVNGLKLHYLDWGGSGQPMLLLHGMSGNAHSWDLFAPAMQHKYRVIALDQRGHGDSEWAESYAAKDFAADAAGVLQQLGLRNVILIGNSMGGRNAIVFAICYQEFLDKLIIVDIGPEVARAGLKRIRQSTTAAPTVFKSIDEAVVFVRQGNPRFSDELARARLAHGLRQRGDGQWEWKHDINITRILGREGHEDLWAALPSISCPTLIVRGAESDILSPEIALRMKEMLPRSQYVEVPNASHAVTSDNPAGFEAAVKQFLGDHV